MSLLYYTANVLQDPDDPEQCLLEFPKDFLDNEGWREGDEITFKIVNQSIQLINNSKNLRDRISSK